jgi:hypothetical protein
MSIEYQLLHPNSLSNQAKTLNLFKLVYDEFLNMSDEDFQAMLNEYPTTERCTPDKCQGQCQGMGWCYTCEDFRGEAPDDEAEERLP